MGLEEPQVGHGRKRKESGADSVVGDGRGSGSGGEPRFDPGVRANNRCSLGRVRGPRNFAGLALGREPGRLY